MRRDPGAKPGNVSGHVTGAVELPRRDRQDRITPWEQPALRPALPPPRAHHVQQLRREHRVTVLAALALLDPDQQAQAVDIGDLQGDHPDARSPAP
jgi:hypothetical protein